MLFSFLRYIKPIWYFNLKQYNGNTVFPIVDDLPKNVRDALLPDKGFSNTKVQDKDLSWQAFQKGYITNGSKNTWNSTNTVSDEYRFVRKNYKPLWSWYCLFLRLLTFHNPYKELSAFNRNKKVQRINLFKKPIDQPNLKEFESGLIKDAPLVCIVIPTLNRYAYLRDGLKDLERQNYSNFEVIVVDQSTPFNSEFYKEFKLDLKVIQQEEKALWKARNTAINNSKADYFLLYDDDSRVNSDWISSHLKGLDYYQADISSGQSIDTPNAELLENYRYFRLSDLLDTGNVLIKRKVFVKTGLFDRQFEKQRMGDGEFGLRAYLNGFLNISNPLGTRVHLKVRIGGLREMGAWDAFRSNKIWAPKPIPSVLYFYRKYFGNKMAILEIVKSTPPSIIPYRFKRNKFMLILGSLISILLIPLLIYKILKSWRLSSVKLKQGELIDGI